MDANTTACMERFLTSLGEMVAIVETVAGGANTRPVAADRNTTASARLNTSRLEYFAIDSKSTFT